MYIKCDYCQTSIERLLSEHGNDSFQVAIHCSTCIRFHGFSLQHLKYFDFWCFNATFNNISSISWRPVLVVEEAGENHRPWAGKLYHLRVECTIFSSPGQRPCELLPSLGIRRTS